MFLGDVLHTISYDGYKRCTGETGVHQTSMQPVYNLSMNNEYLLLNSERKAHT